jgi:hypothetical protein
MAKYDKVKLLADWNTGKYTERDIASKYRISNATAHNCVKGQDKKLEQLISKQVEINQIVAGLNEQEVSNFKQEVDERSKYIEYFNRRALENVESAFNLPVENQNDVKARAETITKARIDVLGKPPETAIQINNNTTYREMSNDELHAIASKGR